MHGRHLSLSLAVLGATAALAAGCGGSDESGGASSGSVTAADAEAAVAKAASVKMVETPLPDKAKEEGLESISTNSGTSATDKQIIFLFTVKDAGTLGKLKGELSKTPGTSGAKVITKKNVMVLYGDIGSNHCPEVESAIDAL
jgi:hypothetical protein